jgi:CheY-like chemotaxis protein
MPQSAPTVLVADDEQLVLNFTEMALRRAGFRVLAASCGQAALNLCQKGAEHVDLALLDVKMPQMDGAELCIALRQVYPNLRVLFMSGYSEDAVDGRCGADARDFLTKPFTAAQLIARVNQMVARPLSFEA